MATGERSRTAPLPNNVVQALLNPALDEIWLVLLSIPQDKRDAESCGTTNEGGVGPGHDLRR